MLHAFKEQGKLLMDALHLTNKALKKPCGPVVTNDFVYGVHYYRYLIALGKQLGTILNISKNIYLKTLLFFQVFQQTSLLLLKYSKNSFKLFMSRLRHSKVTTVVTNNHEIETLICICYVWMIKNITIVWTLKHQNLNQNAAA